MRGEPLAGEIKRAKLPTETCLRQSRAEQLFRPDVEMLVRLLLTRLGLPAAGQPFPAECFPLRHRYEQMLYRFLRSIRWLTAPSQG
jgi:hypothetical protein